MKMIDKTVMKSVKKIDKGMKVFERVVSYFEKLRDGITAEIADLTVYRIKKVEEHENAIADIDFAIKAAEHKRKRVERFL